MIVSMEINGTVYQGMLFAVNSMNNDLMMNGESFADLFGAATGSETWFIKGKLTIHNK